VVLAYWEEYLHLHLDITSSLSVPVPCTGCIIAISGFIFFRPIDMSWI
jgi:hypothetical protein